MKKSNIAILATLFAASILFLVLWIAMGFNLSDPWDLAFTIVWWVVIIGFCIAIHITEKKRQQAVRIAFVSDDAIFNPEVGLVRLDPAESTDYVEVLKQILSSLDYATQAPKSPDAPRIRFKYIVRSFAYAQDGSVWSGEVVDLANGNARTSFRNAAELANLLA